MCLVLLPCCALKWYLGPALRLSYSAGNVFGGFLRGCGGLAGQWVRCEAGFSSAMLDLSSVPRRMSMRWFAAAGRPPPGKKHTITHGACGAVVAHLKSVALDLALPEQAGETLAAAMQRRSVAATACNERSSRSHLVFTVSVSASSARAGQKLLGAVWEQQTLVGSSTDAALADARSFSAGLLNLVDLAGSERLSKSGATGDRLKETQARAEPGCLLTDSRWGYWQRVIVSAERMHCVPSDHRFT